MKSSGSNVLDLPHLGEIVFVTQDAIRAFGEHRTNRMAAALAYYTLFSLFPLLLLILSLLAFFLDAGWSVLTGTKEYLIELTNSVLPAFSDLVDSALQSMQRGRSVSGIIGLLGLIWAASSTFNHLHIALDQIWGFNGKADLRLTVKRRVISITIVLGLGLFLFIVQAIKTTTYWLVLLSDQVPGGAFLQGLATWLFPFIAASITFGLMYRLLPSKPISWRDVWPGAVLAGVVWELSKLLFSFYATRFANWQAIYGPVAGVIGLLTWLYLSFTLILFGAEFSSSYSSVQRLKNVQVNEERNSTESVAVSNAIDKEQHPSDRISDSPKPVKKMKIGTNLATGTLAGIFGVLVTLVLGIGLILKWKPGRPGSS